MHVLQVLTCQRCKVDAVRETYTHFDKHGMVTKIVPFELSMRVRRCGRCGYYQSLGLAADSLDARVGIRAAELVEITKKRHWQMPMGFSMHEDRAWYDRERSPVTSVTSVWPIDEAGWLAHAIAHHDDEQAP